MWPQVDEECVIKANSNFWEQMLAMTLNPVPLSGEFSVGAGHMLGCVNFSGAWEGSIEVRLARGLAYEATAAMLMQPLNTVGEADALDAAKEIANMIAGGVKSSLPRPCAMTVPESGLETGCYLRQPPAAGVLVVVFRHAAGDMLVRVMERE